MRNQGKFWIKNSLESRARIVNGSGNTSSASSTPTNPEALTTTILLPQISLGLNPSSFMTEDQTLTFATVNQRTSIPKPEMLVATNT